MALAGTLKITVHNLSTITAHCLLSQVFAKLAIHRQLHTVVSQSVERVRLVQGFPTVVLALAETS